MKKIAAISVVMLTLLVSGLAQAQNRVAVKDALDEVTKTFGTKFVYERSVLQNRTTTVDVSSMKNIPVEDVLKRILYPNDLVFLYVDQNHYTIVRNDEKNLNTRESTGANNAISTSSNQAAQRVITGTVISVDNRPLSGISVIAKRSGAGTTTDENGNFRIDVAENDVLVFSSVGYLTQEVTVGNQTSIRVILVAEEKSLQEVVVIAYGTQRKREVTGSVSTISGRDLEDLPPTINLEQALQGRAAGVLVVQESGQPGSATRVRIRGSSSLLGSNQPLYVVDGIPVVAEGNIPDDGSAFNRGLLQQGLSSPLGNINPDDIESISILKDASATALYGSRAANGVVIITTKQGRGKPSYTLTSSLSYQKAQTEDVLNAQQFREIWTEAAMNSTSTAAIVQDIRNGTYFGNANTNWADIITPGNPLTKNINFSLSGSSDKLRYYTAIGAQDQDGSFENSYFNRYNFLVNLNLNVSNNLSLGTSLNLSTSTQGSPDGSLLTRIYQFRPDLPVFDSAGKYSFSNYHNLENPVALSTASNVNKTGMLLGSIFGELKFARDFRFKSSLGVNYNSGEFRSFYPRHTFTGGATRTSLGPGFAQESNSKMYSTLWENTLNYLRTFNDRHNVNAVVGASWQGDNTEYLKASGRGFPQDVVLTNLASATQDFIIGSNKVQSGLISYFGRVNYQFDNKYILSLSARTDGSSKFAEENKWAFFPTVAVGWRISDENFMQNADFVDELKLRASTGVTGQQNFGAYQWRTLFEASNYGGQPAVIQNQLGNSQLKWELTRQSDIGMDFSFFKNRLNGSFDVYEKNTSDLLYFFKTPGNTGYTTVIGNLGKTQNRGVELTLDGDIVRNSDFTWNLGFNATKNNNKLVSLNEDFQNDEGYIIPPNTGSRLKVGEPLGLIYGYVAEGIIQTQSELDALNAGASTGFYQLSGTRPGDIKFKDLDGDNRITTADQTIIGNSLPDFSGGITNTVSYKGLRLSALFTYSVGNDLRWGTQAQNINFSSPTLENKLVSVMNRWTPENPTNQPRAVYGDPNQNSRISSYYVHDASYLRLKNLHLSYDLSKAVLDRTKIINSAMLYVSGTNLLTFTEYPGANPETSNLYNDDVSSGLDNSRFPIARVFTVGLRVGF